MEEGANEDKSVGYSSKDEEYILSRGRRFLS
jgi:hypothetical protein